MTERDGPVRVFVACTPAERLPMRVLAHSIREHATLPVEVAAIHDFARPIPRPRELRNQPRTPFSFQRFLIPELCGYAGRAIYMDADMQVFADIREVWGRDMQGHDLLTVADGNDGRRLQFSVMLLDCAQLPWRVEDIVAGLDGDRYTYEQLMQEMCVAPRLAPALPPQWNSLERYESGATRLLHYTDMDTQPWTTLDNPLEPLWLECLRRAQAAGVITLAEVEREVQQQHVRPSLLAQLRDGVADRAVLRRLDRQFVPPYKSIRSGRAGPWTSWRAALSAWGRRGVRRLRTFVGDRA